MTFKRVSLVAALLSAGLLMGIPSAWAHLPPEATMNNGTPSLAPMLKNVLPTVVNIAVTGVRLGSFSDIDSSNNDKNNQANQNTDDNSQPKLRKFLSLGSGVIVDAKNGYVITNAHVLRNASTVNVMLNDGRQRQAKIIGLDKTSDIAVIQIKADGLTAVQMSNSDNLKVGDFVVAIGNPFGLNQTVTSGIISGLQRTNLGIEGYENFIQTDAPINPGNSGGALVNLSGQLVGINTAIFTPNEGNVGIGFAVPANVVQSVMTQIIRYGSVHRGMMGILIQPLNPALADAMGLHGIQGALVTQVSRGSPAFKAGIEPGDIIQKVDNKTITEAPQVTNIVGLLRMGSKVDLEILRNGKTLNLSLITASPQDYRKTTMAENPLLFGVNLRDFNQITAIQGIVQGVQITGIAQESPLWRATPIGLRPGDVIISANKKPVKNTADLVNIAKESKELVLNVIRNGGAMFVAVKPNS